MKKFLRVIAVVMLLLAIAIPCMAESDECTAYKDGKHVWTGNGRTEATCTTDGEIKLVCKCGETKNETIEKTGHDFGEGAKVKKIYKESTCTEQGNADVYCKNGCGELKLVWLPLAAHKSAKCTNTYYVSEPTCGKDGAIGETYCTVCSKTLTTTVAPATGKHELHRVEHKAKDCTEKSYTQLECKLCGYVDKSSKIVGKAGSHTWSGLDYTLVSEATCTKAEMRAPYCTVCGATGKAVAHGDPLGHKWDEGTVDKKATCAEEGSAHWNCKVCGKVVGTQKIAKLDHTPVWEVVEATCTTAGSLTKVCSECGKVYETKAAPAAGHDTEWKITKEAYKCTAGVMSEVCKTCKAVVNTKEIAATGEGAHKATDEWTIVRQPNAYQEGKAIKSCVYCGTQMAKKYFTNAASLGNAKVDTSKKDTTTSSSSSSSKNNTTSSSSSSKNNTAATTSTPTVKAVVAVEPVVVTEWKLGEKFEIADGVYMTITLNAETNKYDVVVEGVDNIETAKIAFAKADATEAPADEDYIDLIASNWVIETADVDEAAILYIVID